MKTVSSKFMKSVDEKAIREIGIPSLVLMENAGRLISELAMRMTSGKIAVACGKGNNGGDGLVAARYLFNEGVPVEVFLFAAPEVLSSDAAVEFRIVQNMKIPCRIFPGPDLPAGLASQLDGADLIIDALFGTGLKHVVEGLYAQAIGVINQSGKPVLSIDIPSGLDSDTGAVLGCAITATKTGTLVLAKTGLFQAQGPEHAGQVIVLDIGIPKSLLDA